MGELYPMHLRVAEDRRESEDRRFLLVSGCRPLRDSPTTRSTWCALDSTPTAGFSQASARLSRSPDLALGLGSDSWATLYREPELITDEVTIAERTELFTPRAEHYYEHWKESSCALARKVRRRFETSRRS